MYSPAAMEKAPAASPASPPSTTARCAAAPPATPAIRAKLETRPSIAPNTAGRSHPPVTSRCSWWISACGPLGAASPMALTSSGLSLAGLDDGRRRRPGAALAAALRLAGRAGLVRLLGDRLVPLRLVGA